MTIQKHKPRLKGLDEMPRRRALRQYYFAARSRVRTSAPLRWLWTLMQVVLVLLLVWAIARMSGLPLEQEIKELFAQ